MKRKKTMFFPPKSKALAKKISITSPAAFRKSIREVMKNKLTLREQRALQLAQNRVKAILKKRGLSEKERKEFREILKIKLPKRRGR